MKASALSREGRDRKKRRRRATGRVRVVANEARKCLAGIHIDRFVPDRMDHAVPTKEAKGTGQKAKSRFDRQSVAA